MPPWIFKKGRSKSVRDYPQKIYTVSGKEKALRECKFNLNLKTGETAHIVLKCEACGNEREVNVAEPWSDVIFCDCPEEIDENNNAREYAAIEVSYNKKEDKES